LPTYTAELRRTRDSQRRAVGGGKSVRVVLFCTEINLQRHLHDAATMCYQTWPPKLHEPRPQPAAPSPNLIGRQEPQPMNAPHQKWTAGPVSTITRSSKPELNRSTGPAVLACMQSRSSRHLPAAPSPDINRVGNRSTGTAVVASSTPAKHPGQHRASASSKPELNRSTGTAVVAPAQQH